LQEVFGKPFEELWNISDLKNILNCDSRKNPAQVHYPFLPAPLQPDLPDRNLPESFRWFVRNNRRLNLKRGTLPYTLPTPDKEVGSDNNRLPTNP